MLTWMCAVADGDKEPKKPETKPSAPGGIDTALASKLLLEQLRAGAAGLQVRLGVGGRPWAGLQVRLGVGGRPWAGLQMRPGWEAGLGWGCR